MAIIEHLDKARIDALLSDDPIAGLEALDENATGVEGIVSVFAEDEPRPVNMLVVRWSQKHLGLGSIALLRAGRLIGLEALVEAVPADRGQYDLLLPFWASPVLGAKLGSKAAPPSGAEPAGAARQIDVQLLGAEACYAVDKDRLKPSPAARQAVRVGDPEIIRPMFPKLASDTPIYVLSLRGALTSVAAVTHLHQDVARIAVYTIDTARGHGFGRGVLTALADELLALHILPTVAVDLGEESAVRMVEQAGFFQRAAHLKARLTTRPMLEEAPAPSLVQIGRR